MKERLFALKDEKYRDFCSALMPTVDKNTVLGVRMPVLKKLAKEVLGSEASDVFLAQLPHTYYDENNLHGCLISLGKDFRKTLLQVDAFLPYVDNWATCDMLMPQVLRKHPDLLYPEILRWLNSGKTYTVRFAVKLLMSWYLDEKFTPEVLSLAKNAANGEYYIDMAVAWLFATALVKQYDSAVEYLTDNRLPVWVHNKTIQKAVESYRIPEGIKVYLKTLKRSMR